MTTIDKTPLERLIEIFGSPEKAAKKLKLKNRQVVEQWIARGGYIPYCHGTRVMRATKGRISNFEVWLAAARARKE